MWPMQNQPAHAPAVVEAKLKINRTTDRCCIERRHQLPIQDLFHAVTQKPTREAAPAAIDRDQHHADPSKMLAVREGSCITYQATVAASDQAIHNAKIEKNFPIGGNLVPTGLLR